MRHFHWGFFALSVSFSTWWLSPYAIAIFVRPEVAGDSICYQDVNTIGCCLLERLADQVACVNSQILHGVGGGRRRRAGGGGGGWVGCGHYDDGLQSHLTLWVSLKNRELALIFTAPARCSSRCYGLVRAPMYICMCVTKSASGCWEADFWCGSRPRRGKYTSVKVMSVTLNST